MKRRDFVSLSRLACLALVALAMSAAPAVAMPVVGGQYRYWVFSDNNDLRDVLFYYAERKWHAQVEAWDYVNGPDQFRSDIGYHWYDKRNGLYTVSWLHSRDQERFTFGTAQPLTSRIIGRAEISPIFSPTMETQVVYLVGADYYWGSYNFASASIIRDPRDSGFWVFPLRVRLANEQNDWVQVGFAPATERTNGWSVDAKKWWLRVGVESNSRYDFTDLDNIIYTIGFGLDLKPRE